ncbi:MAG TPA: type II toxin-antitoxin system RelE/ParE family toxin [Pseudobdellovibrionaceae bacterium]|nr:type II toxin-antitoxin system RelE/ParE family toxin [Pseudobdellovibrionaceae bacterium]
MGSYRWTPTALKGLEAALKYARKNHPRSWEESLKKAVRDLQTAITDDVLVPKRQGRVSDTFEIDLAPLPFFIAVKIDSNGHHDFLAFLHKRRKYP